MNSALISTDPVARVALSFSAVEAMGQDEKWSKRQKEHLKKIAEDVESNFPDEDEMLEIATAMQRGLHRISLRQGVMRVLARLDLGDLRDEWDRLYGLRSGLIHGTKSLTRLELNAFQDQVVRFCIKIVLSKLRHDGIKLPGASDRFF